ncbi:MAG: phosphate signaling complex protein PhoU [Candidatus Carbobacillus altaicus]|uniref:Phosphate-specific transport system accessory protein PhoU n=1 Tax=Candidatus Carbonibacillus altaicus TaxID=2163959 RepID=A0A2R6XXC2_9BACL|nr:phosphate signaling complex protein PhoU [Candidatus Carbobacillus altaicus]PTQ55067.1 MAG: Phosphate transport system regulatory protein PhoU [Candidatus Carbobacillus altaicus]
MRSQFDAALNALHNDLITMGSRVEAAIDRALKALVDQDTALAEAVIHEDNEINALLLKIESGCFTTIALQQPLGSDLRKIGTMLKVSNDLERIGDHAVSIAKAALRIHNETYVKPLIDTPNMGKIVREMLAAALQAYIAQDADRARAIAERDDEVDALYKAIVTDAIQIMMTDEKWINQGTQFLFVARSLERIGDYVTNICEWIYYQKTGEIREFND